MTANEQARPPRRPSSRATDPDAATAARICPRAVGGVKLQGVAGGRAYGVADDGRLVACQSPDDRVPASDADTPAERARWPGAAHATAALPEPRRGESDLAHRLLTGSVSGPLVARLVGRVTTANVWLADPPGFEDLVATVGAGVYTSHDAGVTWARRRDLPGSSGPMGTLPPAFCRADGALYLGEYPLDDDVTPRVLRSRDGGRSWEPALELPDARHVHAVQRDPVTGDVWVTTGDRDAECAIGRLRERPDGRARLERVGGGDQRWRTVELAFTDDAVLWGVDCAYADVNRVFRLDRDDLASGASEPRVVCELDASVYAAATVPGPTETWVAVATAAETGGDSTAPGAAARDGDVAGVYCASDATGFEQWTTVARYRRARPFADRLDGVLPGRLSGTLPRANGYVYLAGDEHGLYVNPYNTRTDHGTVRRFSPAWLRHRTE